MNSSKNKSYFYLTGWHQLKIHQWKTENLLYLIILHHLYFKINSDNTIYGSENMDDFNFLHSSHRLTFLFLHKLK